MVTPRLRCRSLVYAAFDWDSERGQFLKEAVLGIDRLDYKDYADALAELFSTGEANVLPAAVGIYAQWGAGKVGLCFVTGLGCLVALTLPQRTV